MKLWVIVLGVLLMPLGLFVSNLSIMRPKYGGIQIGPYEVGAKEAVPLDTVGLMIMACGAILALIGVVVDEEGKTKELKDALKALDKLKAEGLITQEENEKNRKEIIERYAS